MVCAIIAHLGLKNLACLTDDGLLVFSGLFCRINGFFAASLAYFVFKAIYRILKPFIAFCKSVCRFCHLLGVTAKEGIEAAKSQGIDNISNVAKSVFYRLYNNITAKKVIQNTFYSAEKGILQGNEYA